MEDHELTHDELVWANRIKEELWKSTRIKDGSISDWECVELALTSIERSQDLQVAEDQAWKLQCFREHYNFEVDMKEAEAMQLLRDIILQMPGSILGLDYLRDSGHYLFVYDFAKFFPDRIQTERDWRSLMGGFYVLHQIMNSNLSSIRQGASFIFECEGAGFHNMDPAVEQRWLMEFGSFYPLKKHEIQWIHAPSVAVMMYSMVKRFVPAADHQVNKMCGDLEGFEGGRIDQLYNQPTLEVAQEHLIQRLPQCLRERMINQQNFLLPVPTTRPHAPPTMSITAEPVDDDDNASVIMEFEEDEYYSDG
ncbi:expressed unknown protein [Seminavis robusta]|uniref:CRAL-TRIO domain-containing protein n=1 Tax=Seminavis robusta TaxID=568900 RepID=A0A9N8DYF6_9STRA|nr:expressed unknown protein [Seminavis robusta]|eukprot:Sro463_g148240.1 n/a (308) ;mRNA; r:36102-37025